MSIPKAGGPPLYTHPDYLLNIFEVIFHIKSDIYIILQNVTILFTIKKSKAVLISGGGGP
jgi:hypothetical protein